MLSEVIPSLRTSDTGQTALNWMDIFKVSHLPIVNDKELLGLIGESDIYDLNMPEEPLGNHQLSLFRPYVLYHQHVFEIMELASRLKLSVIPVLDDAKMYLGVITIPDLLHYFTSFSALTSPGSILVLEVNFNNYSLSQITQIIEGNNARILGVCISTIPDTTQMELTIKLNVTDITSINQAFNRYGYTVIGTYMKHDDEEELMEKRYNLLMKYLSI